MHAGHDSHQASHTSVLHVLCMRAMTHHFTCTLHVGHNPPLHLSPCMWAMTRHLTRHPECHTHDGHQTLIVHAVQACPPVCACQCPDLIQQVFPRGAAPRGRHADGGVAVLTEVRVPAGSSRQGQARAGRGRQGQARSGRTASGMQVQVVACHGPASGIPRSTPGGMASITTGMASITPAWPQSP